MEEEFGDDIEIVGIAAKTVTGQFEVTVDGELVHSKENGDGFCDKPEKLEKVMDAIEQKLNDGEDEEDEEEEEEED